MTQKRSVVIIGGGPAGLTAAWELVKDGGSENYDVTVLEATREFGGIDEMLIKKRKCAQMIGIC